MINFPVEMDIHLWVQNAQNLELKCVSDMPAELPSDVSHVRQRTFVMKRYI